MNATSEDIKRTMLAVLQKEPEGMNIVTLFERALRLQGDFTTDPQKLVLACGYQLDDRVRAGANYQPGIRVVGK